MVKSDGTKAASFVRLAARHGPKPKLLHGSRRRWQLAEAERSYRSRPPPEALPTLRRRKLAHSQRQRGSCIGSCHWRTKRDEQARSTRHKARSTMRGDFHFRQRLSLAAVQQFCLERQHRRSAMAAQFNSLSSLSRRKIYR